MTRLLHLSALAALAGCSHPTPPVAPTPAAVSPALASIAFYVGDWQCEGTEYDAAGHATATYPNLRIHVAPEYDHWLSVAVFEGATQDTSELKGVDADGKWHHLWTGNDGSSGSATSPGWVKNQLVFDDDHPAASSRMRMTFTKLDDTHFTHESAVDAGSGFVRNFAKTCHKV